MKVEEYSLQKYAPLSVLIKDYLNEKMELAPFILGYQNMETIGLAIRQRANFSLAQRELLVHQLLRQNDFKGNEKVIKNILELRDTNAFTVTTGHQLCLATGPLFSIYKIASTIASARLFNRHFPEKKFIPIFWMASEDHDVDEINHLFFTGNKIKWATEQNGAVGRFSCEGIQDVLMEIEGGENAFFKLCAECYASSNTLAEAHRKLVYEIFGTEELVVLDGDEPEWKKAFSSIMEEEIKNQPSESLVKKTSAELEEIGYKPQVFPRKINLFELGPNMRERIKTPEEGGRNSEEYVSLLKSFPASFSPNVILRPVYQEFILPNVAYIGGPGELSYWMQLKGVFDHYHVPFPAILLRDSAIILQSSSLKKMDKLSLNSLQLFQPKNAIVDGWMQELGVQDLAIIKEKLGILFDEMIEKATAVDATLKQAAAAECSKALSGVEHLEKKMLKSQKQKEDVRIQQLDKLYNDLFPNGEWQERVENIGRFWKELGKEGIQEIIESFNPLEKSLKIISLASNPEKTAE